jgi:hypothetical protein
MLQNGQLMGPITIMTQPNNFAANKSPPSAQSNNAPTSTSAANPPNPGPGLPSDPPPAVKTEVSLAEYLFDLLFRFLLFLSCRKIYKVGN